MFVDQLTIKFCAGKGGDGVVAWRRKKHIPKGGPYGGNGGDGGSIIIKSISQFCSLDAFRNQRQIFAERGQNGGSHNKHGRKGRDLFIKVPCGTLIRADGTILHDLTNPGEEILLCKGGKGGKGNSHYKTSTNRSPNRCTQGGLGEVREVELELKLIADVGLVGFPNAGKSTLLSKLTQREVKTGLYPFTTLTPNLSFIEFDDFSRVYLADIPGIILNAHSNRGLGLSFLKHIERSSILIYIIDISGEEGRNPFNDFLTLRDEVKKYSIAVLKKPFLVALNKIDKRTTKLADFKKRYPFPTNTLFEISALQTRGFKPLVDEMRSLTQEVCKI